MTFRWPALVVACLLLAAGIKLVFAYRTVGTNDVLFYRAYWIKSTEPGGGIELYRDGINLYDGRGVPYRREPYMNPPFVIHLLVDTALILKRITGRRMCKTGGEIYNLFERPPRVEGRCDNDGGELLQRPDDREEIVGPRLRAYEKQTEPLVSYYRRLGLLHDVDASKSVEEVEQQIWKTLHHARTKH